MFLFTLGLGLLVRRRWRLFLVVFVLACLNKETTILLTLVFAIHFRRPASLPRAAYRGLLLAQLAIFAVLKTGLYVLYRDNPGAFVEAHFPQHNLDVLKAYPLATVFGWCGVALLVAYRWPEKPAFLRDALWIALPLVVLTFFLGYLDELRDYYEAYPIVLLLILHSVGRIVGFNVHTRNATHAATATSPRQQ